MSFGDQHTLVSPIGYGPGLRSRPPPRANWEHPTRQGPGFERGCGKASVLCASLPPPRRCAQALRQAQGRLCGSKEARFFCHLRHDWKRLRKTHFLRAPATAGAKAQTHSERLTARVNSCPDTRLFAQEGFSAASGSCALTRLHGHGIFPQPVTSVPYDGSRRCQ
jgi:hypothetical protein